ncbi:hypothetical protein HN903_01520 [archaeon]|nr:hypothetical protein [archaeon]MBT7128411.1 hypothetical protein [archaeon]
MEEVWAQNHGYGCWDHHRNFRNVTHVGHERITEAKSILKSKGVLVSPFGYSEAMGYLIDDDSVSGFVMQRRLWHSGDFYPDLKLWSKGRDVNKARKNLEKLAGFLKLPLPPKE